MRTKFRTGLLVSGYAFALGLGVGLGGPVFAGDGDPPNQPGGLPCCTRDLGWCIINPNGWCDDPIEGYDCDGSC
jgi:hypothetical protein